MGKFKLNDFSKLKKNVEKEKKLKEYIKEYTRVCETITQDTIYKKRIVLEYDEEIPDMFIEVPVESDIIDKVLYDIYSKRLHQVLLKFPNGKVVESNVVGEIDKHLHDDVFDIELTWQEPLVELIFYDIKISLFDLISQGIEVYILDYDLHGIDFGEGADK